MKKYLDFKARNFDWCIIRLKDGTKLRITVILTAVIKENGHLGIGTQNVIAIADLPPQNWGEPSTKTYSPAELEEGIIEEDIEFTIEKDSWNVYELEDGTIVSIKPAITMVAKTKYYTAQGEPIYLLNIQPLIKIKGKREKKV